MRTTHVSAHSRKQNLNDPSLKRDETKNKMKCEYCGAEKAETGFFIGASNTPDWVMNEGTGKISCPNCYEKGRKEGQERINAHVHGGE